MCVCVSTERQTDRQTERERQSICALKHKIPRRPTYYYFQILMSAVTQRPTAAMATVSTFPAPIDVNVINKVFEHLMTTERALVYCILFCGHYCTG